MRAAFIPALPPSALLAGMIAPSFRLVNRFCGKSYCARAAAVSGRTRCARYFLGRRSLAGGSHTHPTLAVAWAVFAANGGGASVSSAHLAQETRHVPPGTDRRRASPPAPAVGWFGGVRRPLQVYSESSDMRGGFGSLASARQPYAGRRPAKSTAQPLTK